jgi:uncharacterized membrane protein
MGILREIIERLLGLERGFLSSEGELRLRFDPHWPGPLIGSPGSPTNWLLGLIAIALLLVLMKRRGTKLINAARLMLVALVLSVLSGALAWNFVLAGLAVATLWFVYQRDGRSRSARIILGTLRAALVAFVLLMLNDPILTRVKTLVEPSVVAVLIDDSMSMKVHDVAPSATDAGPSRLEAAVDLFAGGLSQKLSKLHTLRFFAFDQSARPVATLPGPTEAANPKQTAAEADRVNEALHGLEPTGTSTQVSPSLLAALDSLQGQRLAGVVLLSDGRDTPAPAAAEILKTLKEYGTRVYPIALGSDQAPRNIAVDSLAVEESAFKDDLVSVKASVQASGYEPGHPVHLRLTDRRTGAPLRGPDGSPAEKTVSISTDRPQDVELLFKPDQVGPLEIKLQADPQPGEIDDADNVRTAQISVLDARIAVLYVEGYPRWEYRYIKNEMIRDKTVDISCLLTSADQGFAQEGDPPHDGFPGPITRFPESIEELMPYDVILFGDVEPRQFTDRQLQLVSDFVANHGGGFGMVAGPQWSPMAFRNTPIEAILPVNIGRAVADDPTAVFDQGFRPVLTKEGADSSIFRFFTDPEQNARYLKNDLPPLFWYSRGETVKPGVGIVYAEHPTDVGPDGRRAPLLVVSHFGAGRALFSAIDDSWRWRFYTGESVFDTYWVQQLRWLARGKKLGQRRATFTADGDTFELGQQVRLRLGVLDPVLLQQLPVELSVQVNDEKDRPLRVEKLQRQSAEGDYLGSFAADRIGRFSFTVPALASVAQNLDARIEVIEPRLELADPRVNRVALAALASDTFGQPVPWDKAGSVLPGLLPSAARTTLLPLDMPLWNAPAAMILFVLLIGSEWVVRKAYGML